MYTGRLIKALLTWLIFLLLFPGWVQAEKNQEDDLARKAGQMLMVGFRGLEVDRNSPVIRDIKKGRVGINVNLAPVVDVNVNPENPVIGGLKRSFSSETDIVARHAREVILAHRKQGVLTALKHFPGHGSSTEDSHLGFTDVTRTWSCSELKPYRDLFKSPGADMVMTAHVFNARLDPEWPATLSSRVLNGLLRKGLGFDGVIISDDMQMKAITDKHDLETALKKTILAGTDIIIFGNNLVYEEDVARKAGDIILDLVRRDKIPAARIKEAYQRIMSLKEQIADRPAK